MGRRHKCELRNFYLYAVLIDLTDAVAETLGKRFAALSVEMVYRSLPYFAEPHRQGTAADLVIFLAENDERYGIPKRRGNRDKPPIVLTLMDLTSAASP